MTGVCGNMRGNRRNAETAAVFSTAALNHTIHIKEIDG
jgi:hypothetical protein